MTRALASPRRAVFVVVLAMAALVGGPTGVSGQAADAPAPTAILSQDGWWNRAKGPQQGEPENPVRPAIGGAIPAPSTVPATGLGVGAAGGDADKVTAVGLVLEAGIDPLVDSLVLTLKESPANGSNLNSSSAKIIACPITSFWAGVKDGDWVDRPVCDDSQAVPGERAADGTWTFDLTLLAMQWVDPTSGLDQNGVLLVESVDAPMSFQVELRRHLDRHGHDDVLGDTELRDRGVRVLGRGVHDRRGGAGRGGVRRRARDRGLRFDRGRRRRRPSSPRTLRRGRPRRPQPTAGPAATAGGGVAATTSVGRTASARRAARRHPARE